VTTRRPADERTDLLQLFADERGKFELTLRDLDEEQARARPTVSDLTLGGLTKHLATCQRHWVTVVRRSDEHAVLDLEAEQRQYHLTEQETFADALADHRAAAELVDGLIREAELDQLVPLPHVPVWPERQWWSVRRILLHLLREISHHAGHADLIRESLDGANVTRMLLDGSSTP